MSTLYAVIRPPSTQEDEGRFFFIDAFPTLEEAQAKKEELDGYYTHEIWRRLPWDKQKKAQPKRYKRKADR